MLCARGRSHRLCSSLKVLPAKRLCLSCYSKSCPSVFLTILPNPPVGLKRGLREAEADSVFNCLAPTVGLAIVSRVCHGCRSLRLALHHDACSVLHLPAVVHTKQGFKVRSK